jgi:acyl-coenzyme A synthetase/AMP-(fatty) acid ligase
MAYGHAGRVLAAIRPLAVQTGELFAGLAQLDPEQSHRRQRFTVPREFTVPRAVFIAANLPKTPIAKIAKPALRERVSSPPRE